MKIAVAVVAAIIAVPILIGRVGKAIVSAPFGTGGSEPSQAAIAEIPGDYLSLHRAAASACPGLDSTILAAIGDAESKHGRGSGEGIKEGENYMAAGGTMQFLKPTFDGVIARHTIPPGGSNPPSRYNRHDAIYAAAFYLCDSGAQKDIRKALFAYNHSEEYVNGVLAQSKRYGTATAGTGDCNKIQAPNPAAITAINFACGQLGLPYVWGGNGPAAAAPGSTAPASPRPPTTPPESTCPVQRRHSTTRVRWCPLASRCFPATWSSTAYPATSTTSACTSVRARWCTPRRSVSRSRSATSAGMGMTISRGAVQLSTLGCSFRAGMTGSGCR